MTTDTPASGLPAICCDLDGVVWRGDEPIPEAISGIAQLRAAGFRVGFVSNNSSQPVAEVVAKLARVGVRAAPDDVLTSALAAAWLLATSLPRGASVLACGGPGLVEALTNAGLRVFGGHSKEAAVDAVVVGFHRDFDFEELDRASRAVRAGARFVATNLDATYPIPGGMLPGTGAISAAVATASGRAPEVAGKPEAPMASLVREQLGDRGIVVGDRPSSDGRLAEVLGWPFALVLSGVTAAQAPPGGEAIPSPRPPFVAAHLGELAPQLIATYATDHDGTRILPR